jgi:hypothetical protein
LRISVGSEVVDERSTCGRTCYDTHGGTCARERGERQSSFTRQPVPSFSPRKLLEAPKSSPPIHQSDGKKGNSGVESLSCV